ncbi:SNARE domain protein [Ancylostoma duodenale]|uniref:SNARE domain protein n=1 Tax=Ancylostoma duodenale TaxID=51022 RepID=A0A0C2GK36_9BILA|nr:SNARE domain protein [Ancylostoma duodenale]
MQCNDCRRFQRSLRIHRERLQNEYIGVLNRLQGCQRRAAQTEKASMRQIRDAAEQDAEASKRMEEDANDHEKQIQRQRQQQININEIKERQQALQQLEQDIGDVNQIFADLARIVHDQGDMVDSIEANVEHAQIHVEQGASNLQQAVYYNQKARQKKMLLFAFIVILFLIIGLTIYLAR